MRRNVSKLKPFYILMYRSSEPRHAVRFLGDLYSMLELGKGFVGSRNKRDRHIQHCVLVGRVVV